MDGRQIFLFTLREIVELPVISANPSTITTDQSAILVFQKNLRFWAISFLLIAGISIYDFGTIDPIWGLVLVVVFYLTWIFKNPALFIVYAVMMGWAALINCLSLVFGEGFERWWFLLGLFEIGWIILVVRQYQKYRHLRIGNEAVMQKLLGRTSAILSAELLVLLPCLCSAFFFLPDSGALAAQTAQVKENLFRPDMIAFYILMDQAVLSLGLSLAVVIPEKHNTGPAILGVIISAFVLAGILCFIGVGGIGLLIT